MLHENCTLTVLQDAFTRGDFIPVAFLPCPLLPLLLLQGCVPLLIELFFKKICGVDRNQETFSNREHAFEVSEPVTMMLNPVLSSEPSEENSRVAG